MFRTGGKRTFSWTTRLFIGTFWKQYFGCLQVANQFYLFDEALRLNYRYLTVEPTKLIICFMSSKTNKLFSEEIEMNALSFQTEVIWVYFHYCTHSMRFLLDESINKWFWDYWYSILICLMSPQISLQNTRSSISE